MQVSILHLLSIVPLSSSYLAFERVIHAQRVMILTTPIGHEYVYKGLTVLTVGAFRWAPQVRKRMLSVEDNRLSFAGYDIGENKHSEFRPKNPQHPNKIMRDPIRSRRKQRLLESTWNKRHTHQNKDCDNHIPCPTRVECLVWRRRLVWACM